MTTKQQPTETPLTDENMWIAPVNWSHSKEFVTAEFARNLELALRKAKAALQEHARLFGIDPNSPCDKCQAYAAITEALK